MRFTVMHGQSKDALSKLKARIWEDDIINDGLYKNLGYDIAYAQYENEITLSVYTTLSLEDAAYVANGTVKVIKELL